MSDDMEIQKIILRLTRRYNAPGHELVNDDGPAAVAIIEALQAEVERLKGALQQIGEGTRDGQHCALIANVALEAKP